MQKHSYSSHRFCNMVKPNMLYSNMYGSTMSHTSSGLRYLIRALLTTTQIVRYFSPYLKLIVRLTLKTAKKIKTIIMDSCGQNHVKILKR